jgi:hypothetical protein
MAKIAETKAYPVILRIFEEDKEITHLRIQRIGNDLIINDKKETIGGELTAENKKWYDSLLAEDDYTEEQAKYEVASTSLYEKFDDISGNGVMMALVDSLFILSTQPSTQPLDFSLHESTLTKTGDTTKEIALPTTGSELASLDMDVLFKELLSVPPKVASKK